MGTVLPSLRRGASRLRRTGPLGVTLKLNPCSLPVQTTSPLFISCFLFKTHLRKHRKVMPNFFPSLVAQGSIFSF